MRIFSMAKDTFRNPRTGEPHDFYLLHCPDWVNIIAMTPDDQVVLIRQFRAGTDEVTVEIPGGMVDPGEDPATAGMRELVEETGYLAEDVVHLGVVHPNPAFLNNSCHTYLARNVTFQTTQSQDAGEHIEAFTVPIADIPELIGNGTITHALVVVAFSHLQRYLAG